MMKAYILASGKGTRLMPLTEHLPKPMVPFMNRPLVSHMLSHIRSHVRHTRLNVSYNREPLVEYVRTLQDVSHFEEGPLPIGSARTLYLERTYFEDGPTLVSCGDLLCDWDVAQMARFHAQKRALVTVAVRRVPNPECFGVVLSDAEHRIRSFHEKPKVPPSSLISCGIYMISPELFEHWNPDWRDIGGDVLPSLAADGLPIYAWPMDSAAGWNDIGTLQSYLEAHLHLGGGTNKIAEGAKVHENAQVRASAIGAGALVAAHAHLDECVVWPGARVSPNISLRRAVITDRCVVDVLPLALSA